jgi:acetyl esterase
MPAGGVLDGLCPTMALNAEYDDMRALGEGFAASLAAAGLDVPE